MMTGEGWLWIAFHLDRRLRRMEARLRRIEKKEDLILADQSNVNTALERLASEVGETAAELRRLADILAGMDSAEQERLNEIAARINVQADALDALQPKPDPGA